MLVNWRLVRLCAHENKFLQYWIEIMQTGNFEIQNCGLTVLHWS